MTLDELYNLPVTEFNKITNTQLEEILKPYYPAARLALLPEDKPRKMGIDVRMIQAYIELNKSKLGIK